jgi:hypothetical protein
MDPAASAAAAPAACSEPKKQPKARKPAKDLMPDERRKESEKRAGLREAVKNRQNAARIEEECRLETERFLAAQALANSKELAGKAAVRAVMMMKQEAINVAFGGVASVPPLHSVGGALSTSSVTSTPRDGHHPCECSMFQGSFEKIQKRQISGLSAVDMVKPIPFLSLFLHMHDAIVHWRV